MEQHEENIDTIFFHSYTSFRCAYTPQSCLEQTTVDMCTVQCSLGNQVQIPGSKVFKQSGLIHRNCQEFCIELTRHVDFLHWGYQTRDVYSCKWSTRFLHSLQNFLYLNQVTRTPFYVQKQSLYMWVIHYGAFLSFGFSAN